MKTILLVCSAGMSTSLLVTKMQKVAAEQNVESDISAVSASEVDQTLLEKDIDVLLLGPQVRYMKPQFDKKMAGKNIPVDIIDMKDYGMMNGVNVLAQAIKLIDNK
ncbi:PTS system, cellobiose-specific IIB component [Halolactibacillus halophilus]|uniref:PTS sugar transporter subunit IIB n=1 Tax=Halolactibacillus halophilus TaxID=306540 RepID=A0A1I5P1J4_9BACI|nr:PTS sugar transporter subunit IIB [Halolactibacillus halophilus]GEM01532.1 PTS sugar transporter subunit IIB [Halolactibacillus halophilus]SFP27934.1 PTS system, cellobiose-specific IIB component [Halolactibacillus halophilus]